MRSLFRKMDSATDLVFLAVVVMTGAMVLLSIYPDVQNRSNNFYLRLTEDHCVHEGERFVSVFLVGDDGELRRPARNDHKDNVLADCAAGQQELHGLQPGDKVTNEYGTPLRGVLDDSGLFTYAEGYTTDVPLLPAPARPIYRFMVSLVPVMVVLVSLGGMGVRAMHAIWFRDQSEHWERMTRVYSVLTPLLLSAVVIGLLSMAERDLTTAGAAALWILPVMIISLSALEVWTDLMKVKEIMAKNKAWS